MSGLTRRDGVLIGVFRLHTNGFKGGELDSGAPMPSERNVDVKTNGAPPAARVIRVLVADDNRDTVLTLIALLRDEGYDTKGAYTGHDALVAIADYEPHVIIADIDMPQRSGWDLARAVRRTQSSDRPDRPLLIAISGVFNKGADRVLGQLAGFNHFLSKPFDPNALLRLLPPVKPADPSRSNTETP